MCPNISINFIGIKVIFLFSKGRVSIKANPLYDHHVTDDRRVKTHTSKSEKFEDSNFCVALSESIDLQCHEDIYLAVQIFVFLFLKTNH